MGSILSENFYRVAREYFRTKGGLNGIMVFGPGYLTREKAIEAAKPRYAALKRQIAKRGPLEFGSYIGPEEHGEIRFEDTIFILAPDGSLEKYDPDNVSGPFYRNLKPYETE